MSYRINIEEIKNGEFTHLRNFTVNNIDEIVDLIENSKSFLEILQERNTKFLKKRWDNENKAFLESDLFDKKAVGKGTTALNHLKIEMEFN